MTERKPYRVVTENTGWSYVEWPDGRLSGPWRYQWEAEEEADALNHGKGMSDGFTITGCDGHCLANGCARQELRAEIERLQAQKAALEEALREYACTASDHPCGCYDQFLSEKAEIERLRTDNDKLRAEADHLLRMLDLEKARAPAGKGGE